jgi:small subunit ribosomal protein S13e
MVQLFFLPLEIFHPSHKFRKRGSPLFVAPLRDVDFIDIVFSSLHTVLKMGRMHTPGKGMAGSALPYKRTAPSWVKADAKSVEEHVCKLSKKGLTPSRIGALLRDSNGVPQVKAVTGNKILRILKKAGLAPEIPEDLYMLIKKAVAMRKHLSKAEGRKDRDSKFRLILVESRIHRLSRYYRLARKLPATFKYEAATASAMVA